MTDGLRPAEETPRKGRFSLLGFCQLAGIAALLASWMVSEHFLPWVSWHAEVPVFAAVFLVGCLASTHAILNGGWAKKILFPRSALILVGLLLLVAIQTASEQIVFAGDGLVIGLYAVLYLTALLLGYAIAQPEHRVARDRVDTWSTAEILAAALLVGAVASVFVALAQVTQVWEAAGWIVRMPDVRRPGANLAQPNQLGTLLLMGLASAVYLYEKRRLSACLLLFVYLLLAIGLVATESRSGVLSFLVMTGWWFIARKRFDARLAPAAVVLALAILLLFFGLWPSLMAVIGVFASGATVNTGSGQRLEVWAQLAQALFLHPWLGWGLREISRAHNAVVDAYAVSQPFTYAHNIVLDLMLGTGLPIALLLVTLVGKWGWQRMRATRDSLQWYCIAATLPLATHSMFEFPYAYAYLAVPALFLIGILEVNAPTPPLQVPAWPLAIGALSVAILAIWTVSEYVDIEEDFRVARFEAIRVQTPPQYERPKIHLLTQLDGLLAAARIEPKPGMSEHTLEISRKAALRYPWPATQNRYAMSLALNGQRDEALRQLRVIRALHGERVYLDVKASWRAIADEKYPQLRQLPLP